MLPELKTLLQSDTCRPLPEDARQTLFNQGRDEEITLSLLRLVNARASKRFFRDGKFSFDDLFMSGYIGLQASLKSYDPAKGGLMSVWAYRHIDGYMQNCMKHKHDNDCTSMETETTSGDDDESQKLINTLPAEDLNPEQLVCLTDEIKILMEILEPSNTLLTTMEKGVLGLYFGITTPDREPLTLEQIGNQLNNYTKAGILAIKNRAMIKIREELEY